MKITLLQIGETSEKYLLEAINIYQNRLKNYIPLSIITIPALKNVASLKPTEIKTKEAKLILEKIINADFVVLLDEKGKKLNSSDFASFIQNKMNASIRNLYFVIGGAYGVDELIKTKTHFSLSLSDMTFTHQLIRLLFLEQLYRAFTILNNEKYHNY